MYESPTKYREKMPCKGICIRHKTSGLYANGHKRCQYCNLFIKWDGLYCPCCRHKLRTGPRKLKYKVKRAIKEQKGAHIPLYSHRVI